MKLSGAQALLSSNSISDKAKPHPTPVEDDRWNGIAKYFWKHLVVGPRTNPGTEDRPESCCEQRQKGDSELWKAWGDVIPCFWCADEDETVVRGDQFSPQREDKRCCPAIPQAVCVPKSDDLVSSICDLHVITPAIKSSSITDKQSNNFEGKVLDGTSPSRSSFLPAKSSEPLTDKKQDKKRSQDPVMRSWHQEPLLPVDVSYFPAMAPMNWQGEQDSWTMDSEQFIKFPFDDVPTTLGVATKRDERGRLMKQTRRSRVQYEEIPPTDLFDSDKSTLTPRFFIEEQQNIPQLLESPCSEGPKTAKDHHAWIYNRTYPTPSSQRILHYRYGDHEEDILLMSPPHIRKYRSANTKVKQRATSRQNPDMDLARSAESQVYCASQDQRHDFTQDSVMAQASHCSSVLHRADEKKLNTSSARNSIDYRTEEAVVPAAIRFKSKKGRRGSRSKSPVQNCIHHEREYSENLGIFREQKAEMYIQERRTNVVRTPLSIVTVDPNRKTKSKRYVHQ